MSCLSGVIRTSEKFPGVRVERFDRQTYRLVLKVPAGFDRYHELVVAVQSVANPIEMFRATLVQPRQLFLYLDSLPGKAETERVAKACRAIPKVHSAWADERGVVALVVDDEVDRRALEKTADSCGYRAEIFETRYQENLDARFSDTSHHVGGAFAMILAFLIIMSKLNVPSSRTFARIVAAVWILGGLAVMVYSDPDAWPYQRNFTDSISDIIIWQHKVLALAMMGLGVAEWLQVCGKGWKYLPTVLFLLLSVGCAIVLQFHVPYLSYPAHVETYQPIITQHFVAALVGAAAVGARALHEFGMIRWRWFTFAWPLLLMVVGVILIVYQEPVW